MYRLLLFNTHINVMYVSFHVSSSDLRVVHLQNLVISLVNQLVCLHCDRLGLWLLFLQWPSLFCWVSWALKISILLKLAFYIEMNSPYCSFKFTICWSQVIKDRVASIYVVTENYWNVIVVTKETKRSFNKFNSHSWNQLNWTGFMFQTKTVTYLNSGSRKQKYSIE